MIKKYRLFFSKQSATTPSSVNSGFALLRAMEKYESELERKMAQRECSGVVGHYSGLM
jgi:hypothetical protein